MGMRYFVCAQKGLNCSFLKKPKVNLLNITHQIFFSFFARYFGDKNRLIYKNSSFFYSHDLLLLPSITRA